MARMTVASAARCAVIRFLLGVSRGVSYAYMREQFDWASGYGSSLSCK